MENKLKEQIAAIKKVRGMIQKDWIGKEKCFDLSLQCAKCMAGLADSFLGAYVEMLQQDLKDIKKKTK